MQEALRFIIAGGTLDLATSRTVFAEALSGKGDPIGLGGLLCAMAQRGESAEELTGATFAMRDRMQPFEHDCPDAIDVCGTGGDGLGTFNISTAAAIVAAAAGARVIKHGNRANTSQCGSGDLLEAVGVRTMLSPPGALRVLEEVGITFLYVPRYHPFLRNTAKVRKALGIRTIFDLAMPLANPARLRRVVLGVPAPSYLPLHAEVLDRLGVTQALVVHGAGGADELTLAGPNQVAQVGDVPNDELASYDAALLGLEHAPVETLAGGDPRMNAVLLTQILNGRLGPLRDTVVLNAAAALQVAQQCSGIREGISRAQQAIDGGSASALVRRWAERSVLVV
jgi:anthranilate phosphoribosyltransferase